MKAKKYIISLSRAIEIASNHNCVPLETAKKYTLSELKEIFKHLGIVATIK